MDPATTPRGQLPAFQRPYRVFHWADYLAFSLVLAITVAIGVYYGVKRKGMSVNQMLMGGRNLRVIPVSLSLLATFISTLIVIGVPSETYYAGEWPIYILIAFVPATIVTAHVFVPIFHRLGVSSAYEYLGLRFSRTVRWMGAINFTIMTLVVQAVTVYTPAVAFSLVAGISLEVSVITTGVICTFYTALGGLRAVVATDIVQVVIILLGVVGLLIYGAVDVGGITNVFDVARKSERLQIWNYAQTTNATFNIWAQLLGGSFVFLNLFAANQSTVQRYCSIKKCRDAQKAVYVTLGLYIVSWFLVLILSLVIFAFYYACDPLLREIIYSPDQIVPLYIMDTIGHLHGLPGLFTACIFGAVLSTVSSGINSLAAVCLEDMIRPLHRAVRKEEIAEHPARIIVRTLAVFFGLVTIALAYLPVRFGTFLLNIDLTFSILGVFGGPLLGVFIMGMVFPIANSKGAIVGMLFGLLFTLWMWIGRILCVSSEDLNPPPPQIPPVCVETYNITSYTDLNPPIEWPTARRFVDCPIQELYDVSYLWYGMIGTGVTLVIGTLISFATCGDRETVVDPTLLCFGNTCYRRARKVLNPGASNVIQKQPKRYTTSRPQPNPAPEPDPYHIYRMESTPADPVTAQHHQKVQDNPNIVLWY